MKNNIERLGFNVIELENGQSYPVSERVNISVFAADNCNPEICGRMFGCVSSQTEGSSQLDSLCVIENDGEVLVNTNDCPWEISKIPCTN